jgi:flagellar motility protein MotE (MotC chaperone)
MLGVPPKKIALIGPYISSHKKADLAEADDPVSPESQPAGPRPESEVAAAPVAAAPQPAVVPPTQPAARPPARAGLGVLSAFSLDSPLSASQLAQLVDDLRTARAALQTEEKALAARQRDADARALLLDERERQIEDRMADLDEIKSELLARELEVRRLETEMAARQSAPVDALPPGADPTALAALAGLFQTGKPDELSKRLLQLSPAEAAPVLRALSDERAAQILNALPTDKWKGYATAYGKAPRPAAAAQ